MNQFEMIVLIVAIVMIASVFRARYRHHSPENENPQERAENMRLRDEVKELKDRLHVLERIATEKDNSLGRQIDELRDR